MSSSTIIRCVFLVIFIPLVFGQQSLQFGRESFPIDSKTLKCTTFTFPKPFTSSDVHVHITIHNALIHEAAVGWVEEVTQTGFTGCVVASGPGISTRQLSADWMAFEGSPPGTQTGRIQFPLFTTGTRCWLHRFTKDWVAMTTTPSGWNEAPENNALDMLNTGSPPAKFNYGFCQNVSFAERFFKPPCIITTVAHQYKPLVPLSISPSENALTEWTEAVSREGFSVCVKDIQALDAPHTPVTIQFIALGQLDPCNDVNCPFYATCKPKSATMYECLCDLYCPTFEDNLCSAQGITYNNECEYKKAICLSKKHVGISHPGSCKPFIVQRGFASLDMSSDEMKCSDISYNASNFYSLQPVHVLLTINHGGQTNGLVHDAVNTWVENVGEGAFTACAMKSGRLEHEGPLPPDYGLASVDWVAFQGSPRGGLVGVELIENWWEGTTCKLVALPPSWLAFEYLPRKTFAEFESVYFPNGKAPVDSNNHAFCQNVTFKVNYMKKPTVMISATHNSSVVGLLPDYNSITSWIEV
ncbi:hypothetical protein OS493_029493 [Desmophyllum pertusum]|uniref:Kazal-like domain-containing protein n=1 Tax=Desmophyllum pertusum TaxID=174260 RepID=A0A9X0CD94_9CNID|nr:hypothetical protein OS493_029493 [Desmophyllum pertusum]